MEKYGKAAGVGGAIGGSGAVGFVVGAVAASGASLL